MKILSALSRKLVENVTELRRKCEAQKAKAQEEAKAAAIQNLWDCLGAEYSAYLQLLIDCISNTYSRLGLNRPGNLPQHMAPYAVAIFRDNIRGLVYRYTFDRGVDVNAGNVMQNLQNHTIPLTTNPATQMAHQINQVLPNYCCCNGLAPVCIDRAYDLDAGKVCFEIVSLSGGGRPL